MSPRVKAQLYHSLAQLIRAGVTFPRALEKLSQTGSGGVRQVVARIRRGLARGQTIAEACSAAELGATEAAVLTAVERAGSLDRGLEELARHFEAVASARGRVIAKLVYPAFMLVLGIVLLNLPLIVREGAPAYVRATVPLLCALLAGSIVFVTVCKFLAASAAFSPVVDTFVRMVPLVGGMQRAFAMSRFCLAYELQLNAGINVIDALQSAGAASRSGRVRSAVASVLPKVRAGSQVGPLLAAKSAIDPEVAQGIIVGEESGSLGNELRRLSASQSERAFGRLDALAEWLPRLIYTGVLIYVGASIVRVYRDYLGQLQPLLEGL